jgi:hypothetical protein
MFVRDWSTYPADKTVGILLFSRLTDVKDSVVIFIHFLQASNWEVDCLLRGRGFYFLNLLKTERRPLYLTLSLLMSYIYGAPFKAINFNVVYIWTYVW